MAKAKGLLDSRKVTFGKRKKGSAKKAFNITKDKEDNLNPNFSWGFFISNIFLTFV
jgi:hypothetical protein